MSSGASAAYENPRSGWSTCIEEMPRSISTASACVPVAARLRNASAKLPRTNRVRAVAFAANASK